MKKLLFLLMLLPLFATAQRIGQFSGTDAVVYSMPTTSVKVTVVIEKEILKAGPYADYADIFLSMPYVSRTDQTTYNVKSVAIEPSIEADYENTYALPMAAVKGNNDIFKLTSLGVILTNDSKEKIGTRFLKPSSDFKLFPDRLPSSPMETSKLTTYDRIKTDSGFIQVPFSQNIVNKKNDESKAEEASRFLFALRQRRFELITGDIEGAFNGDAMKDAVKEINRLEREYLSLFIGKSITEVKTYTFYINPHQTRNKSTYQVCRFSETKGIINEDAREGKLITLDVTPEGKIDSGLKDVNVGSKVSLLYYKVPDFAKVQLMKEGEELCSGRMPIYQLGKVLSIPADVVFNTK